MIYIKFKINKQLQKIIQYEQIYPQYRYYYAGSYVFFL